VAAFDNTGSRRAHRTGARPVSITDVTQKKQWIDAVGPMAMMFIPPVDFDAYSGGVYVPTTTAQGGAHCILVVGFNDDAPVPYWIVKNSWGTAWGMQGFGYIAYSANLLEPVTFLGVHNVNPDPLTKRRPRNGAMIESGNGAAHNNFELFVQVGSNIEHWWRENANSAFDAVDCPAAIQSTFNRNFELLYRTANSGTGDGRVRHVYFDESANDWLDATTFGPSDPLGVAGFVQSNRGAPGDFEAVVLRQNGAIEHWTKHNSWPWTQPPGTWSFQRTIDMGLAYAGAALVQSRLGITGVLEAGQGELHYAATGVHGEICHYKLAPGGSWWLRVYQCTLHDRRPVRRGQ
jgi:hypothetical protein